jgi:2-polyprenyl-6-methoxyphenol hydroxylase-like FAD-dependent oxidoreductase
MKIAIIGAGSAGLTAAYQLCKKGIDVEIFESSDAIARMAKQYYFGASLLIWVRTAFLVPIRE